MNVESDVDRRSFLRSAVMATSTALFVGAPQLAVAVEKKGDEKEGVEDVSPVEDLMREHGALRRILLIYDEAARRIQAKEDMNPDLLRQSAKLIHDFIESYHEKLEEEYVFPRLKKAHHLLATVDTLLAQHKAGRRVTEKILALSTRAKLDATDSHQLLTALIAFKRMYRPHAAREDTVVFPEFKKLVTPKEYDRLGERFENKEHQLFGKEGFEGVVAKIVNIEKAMGIHELAQYTPRP
jgi:hemerythrin-like domain-containing protein